MRLKPRLALRRKGTLFLPLFLLFVSAITATAAERSAHVGNKAEECELNVHGLEPKIKAIDPRVAGTRPFTVDSEHNSVSQAVRLSDGVRVEYIEGGCQHLLSRLSFRHVEGMPKANDPALFPFLRAQLDRVPFVRGQMDDPIGMLAALQKAAAHPGSDERNADWPKTGILSATYKDADINADVSLTVKADGFELEYFFAL